MPKKPRKRKLYAAIAKLAVRVEKMRRKKEHAALQRDGVDVSAGGGGCCGRKSKVIAYNC